MLVAVLEENGVHVLFEDLTNQRGEGSIWELELYVRTSKTKGRGRT